MRRPHHVDIVTGRARVESGTEAGVELGEVAVERGSRVRRVRLHLVEPDRRGAQQPIGRRQRVGQACPLWCGEWLDQPSGRPVGALIESAPLAPAERGERDDALAPVRRVGRRP